MVGSVSPNASVAQLSDRTTSPGAIAYDQVQAISELWALLARSPVTASTVALHDPHVKPEIKLTYAELYQQIQQFASGLQALGIRPDEHVALFSDNSPRWLIADQGIMTVGAIDVVRGSQADAEELAFILEHSDSITLVVQDKATLKKVAAQLSSLPIRFVVVLSDEPVESSDGLEILSFQQVLELGATHTLKPAHRRRDTLATLMYTSGTSGKPKGVMLNHSNLLSQIAGAAAVVKLQPGDRVLSILPIWHCYERTFEYFIFAHGCTQIYTNIRHVKKDLKDFQPHYMVGVPRLWESIYEGVQKQFREQPAKKQKLVDFFVGKSLQYVQARRIVQGLSLENLKPSVLEKVGAVAQIAALWAVHQVGDRLVYRKVREGTGGAIKYVVSGGGSIAEHLEDFFEAVGIPILGGYGLTETSPITHVRRPWRNLRGGDGQPLPHTETRIVDPETRQPVPTGKQGLVLIRGLQVMQGYYKNPEATAKAIDPEGWFDTGDLGWVTEREDLIITGRAKDTIVLTNGENIEPQPIEDACLRSVYIDQIMLVGQDQRSLGALIVPNLEALAQWAQAQNVPLLPDGSVDLQHPAVQELYRQELNREVKNRPGYRADDRIGPFRLLSEAFTIDNGLLTQTLKIRRAVVTDRYRGMIDDMFA
ncbi:long-chain fatty acid--CoA ligase [Oscillatoria sp. FACHB-1407]|uniref:long-chain fatty acid--CoA ligase n=1 Tax=Oscillatoria sp. FACHB-1407 TaxID=2692847 RepID=UPI001682F34E|nr:long-chain fatty acid--CoA ligase [Oscillatoria sp. FACHB-1407]MBD2464625.1 long-chain fatty acid--CoA ligase [Oscillatoria sp. FACHB-1407]